MIDFASITAQTDSYNFHSHTQFCDGRDTMEHFVQAAIDAGMKHYGFSPHAPIPVESPCNMSRDDVPAYLEEVKQLQATYGNLIHLYAAMEIDYTAVSGPADDYYHQLPLDYTIGSVHFIPVPDDATAAVDVDGSPERFIETMHSRFGDDIEWVVRAYYQQMMRMVDAGGFDVVGHLDKIGLNASVFQPGIDKEPWYDRLVRDLIDNIMDHHLVIEVNTKQWTRRGRLFPDVRYFSLLKHFGATIIFNSDTHEPHLVDSGRHQAMEIFAAAK